MSETVNKADEAANEADEAVNEANETINEAVNETDEAVNARQQWFFAQISAGRKPDWADLAGQWQVSRSTAQRDIAALKVRGLIEFIGAPKTGFYRPTKQA